MHFGAMLSQREAAFKIRFRTRFSVALAPDVVLLRDLRFRLGGRVCEVLGFRLALRLVLRTGSQEKNSCRQCRALSHIRPLPGCNKRPDPGPIGQLGSYCSPAQAMKANTTTAAMKSKLSASPNNGASAAFVARVDVVLLNTFASIAPPPRLDMSSRHSGAPSRRKLASAPYRRGRAPRRSTANCGVSAANMRDSAGALPHAHSAKQQQ